MHMSLHQCILVHTYCDSRRQIKYLQLFQSHVYTIRIYIHSHNHKVEQRYEYIHLQKQKWGALTSNRIAFHSLKSVEFISLIKTKAMLKKRAVSQALPPQNLLQPLLSFFNQVKGHQIHAYIYGQKKHEVSYFYCITSLTVWP